MNKMPAKLNISWEEFMSLGKAKPKEEYFNMSYLASHFSQGINGVSKMHGEVSKKILRDLFTGYMEKELEIGYVTNGVHYSTWVAKEWRKIHEHYFSGDFRKINLTLTFGKKFTGSPMKRFGK